MVGSRRPDAAYDLNRGTLCRRNGITKYHVRSKIYPGFRIPQCRQLIDYSYTKHYNDMFLYTSGPGGSAYKGWSAWVLLLHPWVSTPKESMDKRNGKWVDCSRVGAPASPRCSSLGRETSYTASTSQENNTKHNRWAVQYAYGSMGVPPCFPHLGLISINSGFSLKSLPSIRAGITYHMNTTPSWAPTDIAA